MEVLKVVDLSKAYGNKTLFENISFVANSNEKIALIGKNGSGKTSLLDIITGKDIADSGQLSLNKSVSYTYLEQEPKFNEDLTVLEQVYQSSDQIALAVKQYELAMNSGDENAVNEAINLMDSLNAWEFEREIKTILSVLKITEFDKQVSILSGGQKKRLALANALVNKPDFLILDEPTNHLDFQMIEWLEDYLKSTSLTLLMVTHDRYFLDKVCNTIFEIDNYSIFKYSGTYSNFLEKRQERMDSTKASIQKAQNLLRIESKWMSRQPQARATKAKHRIDNYYKLKEDASKKLDESTFEIEIEGKRLGKKLIDIYNISKSFGDQVIINDFSFKFSKGEKIAVIGNNGAGKSTLLNIIASHLNPDSGSIETGETIHLGYFQQSVSTIDESKKLIEVLTDIAEVVSLGKKRELSAGQFAEYFMFPRTMQHNFVSQLSGGEKRRLQLMTVLMRNPNFLILDEPTNDLDIMTLNVLEEYISQFKGTVLYVSHDRYFIDKTADTLFVFEGEGNIKVFPGNYSAYAQQLDKKHSEMKSQSDAFKAKQSKKDKVKKGDSNKMSYKEKVEFESLEKELEQLNTEKQEIEGYLSIGNFNNVELTEKSQRLAELNELIDKKEMRCLELSEKA